MTAKLVDDNSVLAEGSDDYIIGLERVLLADPEDVSEEDELKYETELRTLSWCGRLRIIIN